MSDDPTQTLEQRVGDALHAEVDGVTPGADSLGPSAAGPGPPGAADGCWPGRVRPSWCGAVALSVPALRDDGTDVSTRPDPAPSTTTAPSTTAPPPTAVAPDLDAAVWPDPAGELFDDPVEATRSFVEAVVGVSDPRLSEFAPQGPDAGEVTVARRGEDGQATGIASTVSLRRLDGEHWFVTGAVQPFYMQIDSPLPVADVASPLTVTGTGSGYEGTVVVELRFAIRVGRRPRGGGHDRGGRRATGVLCRSDLRGGAAGRGARGPRRPGHRERRAELRRPPRPPRRPLERGAGGTDPDDRQRVRCRFRARVTAALALPQLRRGRGVAGGRGRGPPAVARRRRGDRRAVHHRASSASPRSTRSRRRTCGPTRPGSVSATATQAGGPPATSAVVHLVRFGPHADSPWEVVGTRDTGLTLDTPRYGTPTSSPATVGGTVTGVDECLVVQVRQTSSPAPLGEAPCVPAGGEGVPWQTTVAWSGASDPALTVVVWTGGHVQGVERFAVTGVPG